MKALRIDTKDNVAVLLDDVNKGDEIEITGYGKLHIEKNIRRGNKIALMDIKKGRAIIKYGAVIGYATEDIKAGSGVHTHNVVTGLDGIIDYRYEPEVVSPDGKIDTSCISHEFMGYLRTNGEVGIRNEVWIIPTVACVNEVAKKLEELGRAYVRDSRKEIDEVVAFTHPYGCSQTGEDKDATEKVLAGLATHPNAGGVLLLGLGCENSGVEAVIAKMSEYDKTRVSYLICQNVEDEIQAGEALLKELINRASKDERKKSDIDKLTLGLKCGGSDGLSGITANPLLGSVADRLINAGGSCIMTEVPEMFGAEKNLMNRCKNEKLFNELVNMINRFKTYFIQNNQTIYENPSPGNIEGGITTLEDKSLGCTQKSGTSQICGIIDYGDKRKDRGLNLLYAPGNDPVAATALAAAHVQMILFTTGRGTPFAAPVPTMKISSNSELAKKKSNWIDYDAGKLVDGKDRNKAADELFEKIIACAEGAKVCSEKAGYHDMAIFKRGITL